LLPEGQVDIDRLIRGAVEGPHRRLAVAATRRGALGVDDHLGLLIAVQLGLPDIVDVAADDIDELTRLVLGRADLALFGLARAAELAGQLGRRRGIDVEDEIADGGDDHDADAAARDGSAAHAAPILDAAAALSSALPAHDRPS